MKKTIISLIAIAAVIGIYSFVSKPKLASLPAPEGLTATVLVSTNTNGVMKEEIEVSFDKVLDPKTKISASEYLINLKKDNKSIAVYYDLTKGAISKVTMNERVLDPALYMDLKVLVTGNKYTIIGSIPEFMKGVFVPQALTEARARMSGVVEWGTPAQATVKNGGKTIEGGTIVR
ncbi:MAG: hypothetical protein US50_C0002G0014 [Candidatus Nomurabacteria bacterium GW2011_GWB1_37_5]|uniref:Uncharacterized protein n=1 Tax=Candidatus Nomurabacteria bacterium GW2011_GWB1_37_5 TaxID=1618742 RepID=A0A0G0JGR3_9BACT|nr:MAG: hypothetical protein US50_C0002G0014 [Candidatus Nomurabacteria bacterium GW2011_GWB1_37_5]